MKRYVLSIVLMFGLILISLNVFAADGDMIINGKVGIGTGENTPAGKLDVEGTDNIILNAGNVGIGKTDPAIKLDVNGEIRPNNSNLSCTTANEGAIRYNSTAKVIELCTGSEYWYRLGINSCAPDSYTKLLLHMDGTNGSTTFTDSSSVAKTVTATGNAKIDIAYKKFGTGSASFDGTGDYLTSPDHADWFFDTGNFSIDLWKWFATTNPLVTETHGICGQWSSSTNYWRIYYTIGTLVNSLPLTLYFEVKNTSVIASYSVAIGQAGSGWNPNQFNHIELTRSGSNVYLFFNGISKPLTVTKAIGSSSMQNVASVLYIGAAGGTSSAAAYPDYGFIDEFRISKGIARHTANFTPPKSPYCY